MRDSTEYQHLTVHASPVAAAIIVVAVAAAAAITRSEVSIHPTIGFLLGSGSSDDPESVNRNKLEK